MKEDERRLLVAVFLLGLRQGEHTALVDEDGEEPRAAMKIADALGIPPNRAAYLFGKWTRKGWYDWGVAVGSGWLTEAGLAQAQTERDANTGTED